MAQATAGTTTIENPIINTPFAEPARHFVMVDGKPTGIPGCAELLGGLGQVDGTPET